MSNLPSTNVSADVLAKLGGVKADIGINEVVSVFVSKYENGLFAKKDVLQADLKKAKKAIEDHDSVVIGTVDKRHYDAKVEALGLTFHVTDVSVSWAKNDTDYGVKKGINVSVSMRDGNDRHSWSKIVNLPLSKDQVAVHETLTANSKQIESELMEVLTAIKSVSRKERELRGRISEMQLQRAGFADLINDDGLQQLIAIK
jgi:hypothetical protein